MSLQLRSDDNEILARREPPILGEKLTTAAQVSSTPNESYNNIYAEGHGDLQVFTLADVATDIKLAKDGRTVLIPQPSDDPDDVLNWPRGKKYRVLLSLIFASMVCMGKCSRSLLFVGNKNQLTSEFHAPAHRFWDDLGNGTSKARPGLHCTTTY